MKVVGGPSEWMKTVACTECSAELEVELDDVLIGNFDGNAWEEGTNEPYCVCSVCESHVRLGRDCPPVVWRIGIENTRKRNTR
jgi:hypothetical protein